MERISERTLRGHLCIVKRKERSFASVTDCDDSIVAYQCEMSRFPIDTVMSYRLEFHAVDLFDANGIVHFHNLHHSHFSAIEVPDQKPGTGCCCRFGMNEFERPASDASERSDLLRFVVDRINSTDSPSRSLCRDGDQK